MAGIYGIWKFGNRESLQSDSLKLRAVVDQGFAHPWHEISALSSSLIFGSAMPQLYSSTVWPLESLDPNVLLLVQGEIFLPSGNVLDEHNWQSEFISQFRDAPHTLLLKLDGAFVFAVFDRVTNKLSLASDRFGNFALHYRKTESDFAFATQMSALARLGRKSEFNDAGVAQFLGLGYTMNGATQFSNISRLPAASLLILDGRGIKIEEYYRPQYSRVSDSSSVPKEALIEEFADIFSQSVLQRTHRSEEATHPVAAALTGGFDSRLTWAAMRSIGKSKSVNAYTLGLPNSRDIELSKRITSKLGIHLLPHYFDTEFLTNTSDYWERTLRLTEGGLAIDSATTVQAWDLQQHEYNVLLDSYGGALYRRQYMRLKWRKFTESTHFAETMFEVTHAPLAQSELLKPELRHAIREQSINALQPFFDRYASIGTIGDQLDFFYITQLSANRNAHSNNAQLNFLGLHHPLYTARGYALVQQIPESLRKRNWIHAEVIRLLAPELTKFPIDNQGMWGPYNGFSYFRYLGMGHEFFLRKAKYFLGNRVTNALSLRRPLTDQELIIRLNADQFTEGIMDLRPELQVYCSPEIIEQSVKHFKESANNRQFDTISALQQLLSLGLWLRGMRE